MTGVLALAIARYEAAVILASSVRRGGRGACLPDGVFAIVIAVAFVTGRFDLSRVPLAVFVLLGAFIFLNLLDDRGHRSYVAARFMAITVYLAVFAVWFTSYLNSERRARGREGLRGHRDGGGPARFPGAVRPVPGLGADPGQRGHARHRPVRGPERVRSLPHPGGADRAGGDPEPGGCPPVAAAQAGDVPGSELRRPVLLPARGMDQLRGGRGGAPGGDGHGGEAAAARPSPCCRS